MTSFVWTSSSRLAFFFFFEMELNRWLRLSLAMDTLYRLAEFECWMSESWMPTDRHVLVIYWPGFLQQSRPETPLNKVQYR